MASLSRFHPLGDRVLCRMLRDSEISQKIGLIFLTQNMQDWQRYAQWVVVACGPWVSEDVQEGDRVLIASQRGKPVDLDGEACMFVSEENVKAVFDE